MKEEMEKNWKEEGYPPAEELKRIRLRRPHVYSGPELCHQMFLRNCHRLTENMVARKVEGWKSLCKIYSDDLAAYWGNRYEAQLALREMERLREEEGIRRRAARKTAMLNKGKAKGEGEEEGEEQKQEEEEEEKQEEEEEEKQEEEERKSQPVVYKKPGRKPLKLMEKRNMSLGWRDHGLYHKVMGGPYLVPSEVTGKDKDMYVLGRKDFWLESYAHVLDDRLTEEKRHEEHVRQKRQEDRIFDLTFKRRQRIYGRKDYVQGATEPQRQHSFKQSIKQHSERKFIVREDLADMADNDDGNDMDDMDGDAGRDRASVTTVGSVDSLQKLRLEDGSGPGSARAGDDRPEGGDDVSVMSMDEPAELSMDATSRPTTAPGGTEGKGVESVMSKTA